MITDSIPIDVLIIATVLILVSRKLLNLSISLCVALFSIVMSVLGIAVASLILTIVAFPVGLVVCNVAEHHPQQMKVLIHDICTPRPKKPDIVATSRRHAPPSTTGKY